jgi:hypothetical protein
VIRLNHWLAIWLCWGGFALLLHAQALPEWLSKNAGTKPPPAFGVVDESNFFNRNSGAFNRISEQLRKLELDHGCRIYLVVEPVLIATTPSELAAELRQAWVPDGNGLVLVFESDSRQLGIGRDLTSRPDPSGNLSRIPSHEISAILARATESADTKLAPEPYLEALVNSLAREYEGYFKRRSTPPPPERSMRIGLLVIGVLAVLGLGAIALGALVRHSSMAASRRFRFPVVDRPERLGAPCGGSVTTRRFAPPVSKV